NSASADQIKQLLKVETRQYEHVFRLACACMLSACSVCEGSTSSHHVKQHVVFHT
ncbi:hypothetical protein LDENG_00138580, partial [Lucifuga dentata]